MPKKLLVLSLVCLMTANAVSPQWGNAQSAASGVMLDYGTTLNAPLHFTEGSRRLSLITSGENVRTILHDLAQKGGFNLVMDDSVSGTVSLSLNNVTIDQAVQAVATMADLQIVPQAGNIYLAISRQAFQDKGLNRSLSKVIKVYYSNANRIANLLNRSLFAEPATASGAGGASPNAMLKVKGDPRTNTLIVVGTAREIELAEAAVARLDVPRQRKTFYLSHGNALDVATMLASSIFNDGTSPMSMGTNSSSSSSSTGASGGSGSGQNNQNTSLPSSLRVEKQDVQEGSGINNFSGSGQGGGGGGGGGGQGTITSGLSASVTLRGMVKSTDMLQISPEGPLVIPDSRQNSVTIFGTAEQIAQAEALIPTLDARLPQVSIEASLIEITESGLKDLGTRLGWRNGDASLGFNNVAQPGVIGGNNGLIGVPTVDPTDSNSFARTGATFSTSPLARNSDYIIQLRSLITQKKAKVLANPTVVATHDTESLISIVDEVVRRVTVQVTTGFATQTVEVGEAGIVMDILPKIGEDGTVNMRLRPSVTSVLSQTSDAQGNIITLLSKRDLLTQNVRLIDGQTLVVGGLIQQSDTLRQDKLPGMGDLPIVGAMFRASQRNAKRSEIVMLITPHIINKTTPTPTISSAPFVTREDVSNADDDGGRQ